MPKEDRQTLGLFVSKCTDKKATFHYPLTTYPLAIAGPSGTLYQPPVKHLFRNELIKLSCDSMGKNTPKNAVHIYDRMTIVRSVASQNTWGNASHQLGYTAHRRYNLFSINIQTIKCYR